MNTRAKKLQRDVGTFFVVTVLLGGSQFFPSNGQVVGVVLASSRGGDGGGWRVNG